MNDSDNKTRIRLQGKKNQQEDKTRLAGSNKTRLKQSKRQSEDATQFKKSTKRTTTHHTAKNSEASNHEYSPELQKEGHHGVLKGRFILAKIIGSGGMGVVYKAKDLLKVEAKDRDPYVAIKVLSEEFKSHPEAFISLQRESRKSQRIAHPNIVNVFDFDRDGDVVFMTMEFMDGRPLDRIIRQYKATGLPTEDAWSIIKSISSALIHAHGMNIIHSDFKPGNIFVTKSGTTKVFDFGIARAVAKVSSGEASKEDRTVFDAGNLGALTPAYASLEMLEGKKPDARDDIYALGCIAYELFTGTHPFNKLPADEAKRQNLTPKRITNITKRQWGAIKQALAFKREERLPSVEMFLDLITKNTKRSLAIPLFLLLTILVGMAVYTQFTQRQSQTLSETDIRNKVEYELKINFHKQTIDNLLKNPSFTAPWEDQLWNEYQSLATMIIDAKKWLPEKDAATLYLWKTSTTKKIYSLYIKKIKQTRSKAKFAITEILIKNAARYTNDFQELELQRKLLAEAINKYKADKNKRKIAKTKYIEKQVKIKASKSRKVELFNIALNNVNRQLQCQSKLNMRNIDVAIKKLKSYNPSKYRRLEPKLINKLVACITELGKPFPEKAQEYKKYALRIFHNHRSIVAIKIIPRDPCNTSLAGLGGRGKRTVCKDKLKGIAASGPDLIVIYGAGGLQTYAISKYEVSIKEFNTFCKHSPICDVSNNKNTLLPRTNIDFKLVKKYLRWLTEKTNKRYRLPTKDEWFFAAKANRKTLDPNRNCFLRTRGIEKGEELVEVKVGRPNNWGMVNYIGNAQEWVYGKGRKLIAVGGSYSSPMDSCNYTTSISSNGASNNLTGFRVVREINK